MSTGKAFASIKRGLEQAIRHRKGGKVARLKLHAPRPAAVKAPRGGNRRRT